MTVAEMQRLRTWLYGPKEDKELALRVISCAAGKCWVGRDLQTVGTLTGHSDKTMVILYSHATQQTIDLAYDAP